MIKEHPHPSHPFRKPMEIPAKRVGHRLGFVVILETGQVAPAAVTSDFYKPGTENQEEKKPLEKQDYQKRRCGFSPSPGRSQEIRLRGVMFPSQNRKMFARR